MPIEFEHYRGRTVYAEVCNRINELERLMRLDELRTNIELIVVVQLLKQIQDRYQLLAIHIETMQDYSDLTLDQRPHNPHCPLHVFWPTSRLPFTMQELPDLSMYVMLSFTIWGDTPDRLFTNPSVAKLVNLMKKAGPLPCGGRSMLTIFLELAEQERTQDTLISQVFARLIIASLLGIYPDHTRVPASFALRHVVYQHFYLQFGRCGDWVHEWICQQKHLLIYMMREYLFYIIERLTGLDKYLRENYYWVQIVKNTHHVMDFVRERLNQSLREYQDLYPILTEQGEFIKNQMDGQAGYVQLIEYNYKASAVHEEEDEDEEENDDDEGGGGATDKQDGSGGKKKSSTKSGAVNSEPKKKKKKRRSKKDMETAAVVSSLMMEEGEKLLISALSVTPDQLQQPIQQPQQTRDIHWHPGQSIFTSLQNPLTVFNKTNLNNSWRMITKQFVRFAAHKMMDLENKNFSHDHYKLERRQRLDPNQNDLKQCDVMPLVAEKWLEYLITYGFEDRKHDESLSCYERALLLPSYSALVMLFNINIENIMELQHAQKLYEMETDRSGVTKTITKIFYQHPRDFRILSTFFKLLLRRISIQVFPLPTNLHEIQLRSIQRYFGVGPDEDHLLPHGAGNYFICRNCNIVKAPVLTPYLNATYLETDARYLPLKRTPVEVMRSDDPVTEILVDLNVEWPADEEEERIHGVVETREHAGLRYICSASSIKPDKNMIIDGNIVIGGNTDIVVEYAMSQADAERARKKSSKGANKKEHSIKCISEELISMRWDGVMVYTDSYGLLMRCLHCPVLIRVSREWIRLSKLETPPEFSEFICSNCHKHFNEADERARKEEEKRRKEHQQQQHANSNNEEHKPQLIKEEEELPVDQTQKVPETTTTTTTTTKTPTVKRAERFYDWQLPSRMDCAVCPKKVVVKKSEKEWIYDDVSTPNRIRFAAFCDAHEELRRYVGKHISEQLTPVSELLFLAKAMAEKQRKDNPNKHIYINGGRALYGKKFSTKAPRQQ